MATSSTSGSGTITDHTARTLRDQCHSEADLGELFDKICANTHKGRGKTTVAWSTFSCHVPTTPSSPSTYTARTIPSGLSSSARRSSSANKLREHGLEFKEAHDLPRKMEPGVGLVPVHDDLQPGWWGIRGKMDIPRFINGLRQLSDLDFCTAKFSFKFIEVRTPKSAAIALLDAIQNREGLMDMIDFSIDNSNDENGTRITSTNSSKRPRATPMATAR